VNGSEGNPVLRYQVRHQTEYSYSEPVGICHNALALRPRSDTPGQTCYATRIQIDPRPAVISERCDAFGNAVTFFTVQEDHSTMTVTAESDVEIRPIERLVPASTRAWEETHRALWLHGDDRTLEAFSFVFDSPHVVSTPSIHDFARVSFTEGRPILEAAFDLARRIHDEFSYRPKVTTISTPIAEVLARKEGVCQDFAHLMLGCLRSLGLAARYVSGYIQTLPQPGREKLVGVDASHAWVSVFCADAGWIDIDPTNALIPYDAHITVAWGRDYADVSPIRGVAIGGGEHTVKVAVDVIAQG
jgi:transglutaminase-like putative cysteine protease